MAGHGGGAWKVAYADFVTAMMAFFLVMWITGQEQSVRHSVAYYFVDPFGDSKFGEKKPRHNSFNAGKRDSGTIPKQDGADLASGRLGPIIRHEEHSPSTKYLHDWISHDKKMSEYWKNQATRQRDIAKGAKQPGSKKSTDDIVKVQLAGQLRDEIQKSVPYPTTGIYRDIIRESLNDVNWTQLAEDFLSK